MTIKSLRKEENRTSDYINHKLTLTFEELIDFFSEHDYKKHQGNKNIQFIHLYNRSKKHLITFEKKDEYDTNERFYLLKQANISDHLFYNYLQRKYPFPSKNVVIGYADILGYKYLMEDCKNNPERLQYHIENFNMTLKPEIIDLHKETKFFRSISNEMTYVRILSDNLLYFQEIVEGPANEYNLPLAVFSCIHRMAEYQRRLSLLGYFVRGYVDFGDAYCDDVILIAPVLTDIVNKEENEVKYPRIGVSERVVEVVNDFLSDENAPFEEDPELIIKSIDGMSFINYLSMMDNETDFNFALHKTSISHNLEKNHMNQSVYEKYVWCAQYHNYYCSLHFGERKDLLIENFPDNYPFGVNISKKDYQN